MTDVSPIFLDANSKLQQERLNSVLCLHKPTDSSSSALSQPLVTAPGSSNSDFLSPLLSSPESCFLVLTRKGQVFGPFCSW